MKKILLIGTFQEGAYAHVIRNVLNENGFEVYPFDHRKLINLGGELITNTVLANTLGAIDFDYILTLKGRGINHKLIKNHPALSVNWWLDNAKRYYDFHDAVDNYDRYYLCEEGQDHPWMSIGIDPKIHCPQYSMHDEVKSDVVFIGTAHPQRSGRVIEVLSKLPATYKKKIWGNSWSKNTPFYMGGAVYWSDYMRVMTNAKFVLNMHYEQGITPNMRSIEAPASKAPMISDTGLGLEQCLKKDKEYISFNSEADARRTIKKYMADYKEAQVIGQAGYERVMKDHLLIDKIKEMFK